MQSFSLEAWQVTGRRWALVVLLSVVGGQWSVFAYEHEDSAVNFIEYAPGVLQKAKAARKPFFILFSAQWCHWCDEFAEKTLSDPRIYQYLNSQYTNVFADVDIHGDLFRRFKGTGTPFIVFLNPDGTPLFRYAGTVYAKDFQDVLKEVKDRVGIGFALGEGESDLPPFKPPSVLSVERLSAMRDKYIEGVLGHFDSKDQGLGKGEKSLYPRTFLYLADSTRGVHQKEAVEQIDATLRAAIKTIFDPIEGGFFRFAETSDWQIPHYEKMADHNAGAALLLLRMGQVSGAPELAKAAEQTLGYLSTTLYDENTGSFLSFQEADTGYYFLNRQRRKAVVAPTVIQKVFTAKLAATLNFLLQAERFSANGKLRMRIIRSLDFVARSPAAHYYSLETRQWNGEASLADLAELSRLYARAGKQLKRPGYSKLAKDFLQVAEQKFFDQQRKIFADSSETSMEELEYLMAVNGLLAQAMVYLESPLDKRFGPMVTSILAYFSGMDEFLEERLWEGREWQFAESYIPYLVAGDMYRARQRRQR